MYLIILYFSNQVPPQTQWTNCGPNCYCWGQNTRFGRHRALARRVSKIQGDGKVKLFLYIKSTNLPTGQWWQLTKSYPHYVRYGRVQIFLMTMSAESVSNCSSSQISGAAAELTEEADSVIERKWSHYRFNLIDDGWLSEGVMQESPKAVPLSNNCTILDTVGDWKVISQGIAPQTTTAGSVTSPLDLLYSREGQSLGKRWGTL